MGMRVWKGVGGKVSAHVWREVGDRVWPSKEGGGKEGRRSCLEGGGRDSRVADLGRRWEIECVAE